MDWYCLTFRSVTLAQRGERILQRGGLHPAMSRAPRWMEDQGCGYCLRLRGKELEPAVALLLDAGLPYGKRYRQKPDGTWEAQP